MFGGRGASAAKPTAGATSATATPTAPIVLSHRLRLPDLVTPVPIVRCSAVSITQPLSRRFVQAPPLHFASSPNRTASGKSSPLSTGHQRAHGGTPGMRARQSRNVVPGRATRRAVPSRSASRLRAIPARARSTASTLRARGRALPAGPSPPWLDRERGDRGGGPVPLDRQGVGRLQAGLDHHHNQPLRVRWGHPERPGVLRRTHGCSRCPHSGCCTFARRMQKHERCHTGRSPSSTAYPTDSSCVEGTATVLVCLAPGPR